MVNVLKVGERNKKVSERRVKECIKMINLFTIWAWKRNHWWTSHYLSFYSFFFELLLNYIEDRRKEKNAWNMFVKNSPLHKSRSGSFRLYTCVWRWVYVIVLGDCCSVFRPLHFLSSPRFFMIIVHEPVWHCCDNFAKRVSLSLNPDQLSNISLHTCFSPAGMCCCVRFTLKLCFVVDKDILAIIRMWEQPTSPIRNGWRFIKREEEKIMF